MAALYELCSPEDRAKFLADMGELIPGVVVLPQAARRQGVAGTHMSVLIHGREEGALPHDHRHDHDHEHEHEHEHHHDHEHGHDHSHSHQHRSLADVLTVIDGFAALPAAVRERAKAIYALIAQAEARGPRRGRGGGPLPRGGGLGCGGGRHRRVLSGGASGPGPYRLLPGGGGQRHGPHRPRSSAGARPGHGLPPGGAAGGRRGCGGGTVHPHRGGPAEGP